MPEQDAAVPLDELVTTLTILISAVSVLPRPAGGRVIVRVAVVVVVVCPNTGNIELAITREFTTNFRMNIHRLS